MSPPPKETIDPIFSRIEAIFKEYEEKFFTKDCRVYFDAFRVELEPSSFTKEVQALLDNKQINAKKADQRILRSILFYAVLHELKNPNLEAAINLYILEKELTDPAFANAFYSVNFIHESFLNMKDKRVSKMPETLERYFQYSPMLGPEFNEYIKAVYKVFLNRTSFRFEPKFTEKAKTTSKFYGRLYEYYIRCDHEFDILLIPFEEKLLFAEFFEAFETGVVPSGDKLFNKIKLAKDEMNSYADPGKTLFGPKRGEIDFRNIYNRIAFTKAIDIIMPTFFKLRQQNMSRIFDQKIKQGIGPHLLVVIKGEDRKPDTLAVIEEDLYYYLGRVDDTLFKTFMKSYASYPSQEDPHYFVKHIASIMANKSIDYAHAALKLVKGYEPLFKGKFTTLIQLLEAKIHGKEVKPNGK